MTETPYYDEYKRRRNLKLAKDANTPVEVLRVLSTDEYSDVRYYVTHNPNTPVEVLEALSTDKDSWVRSSVARNPNTPVEVLKILSTDGYYDVQCAVTRNPNTPVEVLKILSTDESLVRYAVARNLNTPVMQNDRRSHNIPTYTQVSSSSWRLTIDPSIVVKYPGMFRFCN
jgi:hypothetical protein